MKPRYRFTLTNTVVSGSAQEISEPIGWDKIEFNIERHPEYRSLVENFEVPLIFYGSDGVKNGGYDFVKGCIDADMNGLLGGTQLLVEIQPNDGDAYETLFQGLLQLSEFVDTESKKLLQVPLIRNDLWAQFVKRKNMPVNLKDTVDLNGNAITQRNEMTLVLPSQTIQQMYRGDHFDNVDYATTTVGGYIYGIIDFESQTLNEIAEKFDYPRVAANSRPFELFAMKYDGLYNFTSSITLTTDTILWNYPVNSDLYFQINDNTPIAFARANLGTPGVDGRTNFTYSATHTLQKGDFIRVYIQSADPCAWPGSADTNFLAVIGDTSFADSTVPAFLLFDAALSIIEKMIGRVETFYSEYFGGGGTALPLDEDGCGYPHVITKGLHVRGWSLSAKPFQMTFDDWWEGAHKIFGLGLGYETLDESPDREVIRIEKLESFYDSSSDSVTLESVMGIEFAFDAELIHTAVEIGYAKWEAEAASGIDDPQTKHTYNSRQRIVGRELQILSRFYAASLGIEQTRRQTEEINKDWRLDEDIMIIHADLSATPEQPVLFESSPSPITNLLNPETRYNVKLTPYVNAQRWLYYLGITDPESSFGGFIFAKGEGNVIMAFNGSGVGCDGEVVNWTENQDIPGGAMPLIHRAKLARFTHPLTYTQYKAIRNNRKNSIAVKYYGNEGSHWEMKVFIKKMKYAINESTATFEVWVNTVAIIP